MANSVKFRNSNTPRQEGELARLKVVRGPDMGSMFVCFATSVSLGRGDNNDIVISDLKASRNHVRFILTKAGWSVKDLGSANGILFNGMATRESKLKLGDTVTVGETTLEFTSAEAGTAMLTAPAPSFAKVQANEKNFIAQNTPAAAPIQQPILGQADSQKAEKEKQRKIFLIAAVLIAGYWVMSDSGTEIRNRVIRKAAVKQDEDKSASQYIAPPETRKSADAFFKDGMREYFAGNLTRARTQFETALQIDPGHTLSLLYLENCENAVKDEVKLHMSFGRKSFDSGKLREARAHYERVIRLLYRDQTNPSFIEAKEQLEKVMKTISGSPQP